MAETLAALLADAGLRPKRTTAAHTEKLRCPKCDGGRTHEISLSLTIDPDGCGATWRCHRGSCGWDGGGRTSVQGQRVCAASRTSATCAKARA